MVGGNKEIENLKETLEQNRNITLTRVKRKVA